jgi:hypothetical protein
MSLPSKVATYYLNVATSQSGLSARGSRTPTSEAFRADERTYDAVVRNLEIIGEAGNGRTCSTFRLVLGRFRNQ